ncbi:hypothetical protein AF306_15940, partial [Listeria monocytogenes]|nr:hypothetical protein [Listeria monocytogenes]
SNIFEKKATIKNPKNIISLVQQFFSRFQNIINPEKGFFRIKKGNSKKFYNFVKQKNSSF